MLLRKLFMRTRSLDPERGSSDEAATPELLLQRSAAELRELLEGGKPPQILDVREDWELPGSEMPQSIHIPMNQVPDALDRLDPKREVVVVCAHGVRSEAIGRFLQDQGFQASNLSGGYAAWQRCDGSSPRH